ncbi:MAG: adenylate/guanylate cyclase domain-containing protein [Mesorhizobium sp.]|nr:adenylate/guanylate cyclase domain-containing protein [Mesorhizobium sp.]MBL8575746.1 adenylate/guanylate cyclase domain-containing protein [Mesorhizobium sp.]
MRLFRSADSMGIALSRLAGLALLLVLLGLRVADPLFLSSIRNQGFDILQRIHPRPASQQPIKIVDIDEKSLELVGQWPWPRSEVARLIDRLTAMGAVVVGFDVVFAEPDRLSPDRIAEDNPGLPEQARADLLALPSNEEVLAESLRRSRVIVGETSARVEDQTLAGRETPIPEVPFATLGADPTPFLLKFPHLVQNLPVISEAATGRGLFTVEPDPDGIFRRIPLVMMVEERVRLGLSAEMLRIATGGQAFAIKTGSAGIESIVVGGVNVPTDGSGRVWPWFNASSRDRYVSAGSVMSGEAAPESIAGQLVVIGTSAVGLEDFRATPVANFMPGVEIHAQIIENMLTKEFLYRPAYAIGMELVITLVLGLIIIWLVPKIGASYSFFAAATVLGVVAAGVLWAFFSQRTLLDATFPGGTLAAVFMLMATANYMREEQQRRQIRSAFGQYLSPALVDRLADHPEQLVLGGETRELTLLFTDVRGFTTISESFKSNPQGLTRLMNHFLTALSKAILDRDGTIDKYMGDAIMAFWNAPVDLPDHAMRACRAALDMVRQAEAVNARRREEVAQSPGEVMHEIKIGVGINSGECVVGNMGSDMRFDYTALGDTVNLASRLEGQSKPYGVTIILGDNTAVAVADALAVLEIDLIRVKGKNEPERIHTLLGVEDMAADQRFKALKDANRRLLDGYRAQQWDAAEAAIGEMRDLSSGLEVNIGGYLALYESRVAFFRADPPGDGWDGVYTAASK